MLLHSIHPASSGPTQGRLSLGGVRVTYRAKPKPRTQAESTPLWSTPKKKRNLTTEVRVWLPRGFYLATSARPSRPLTLAALCPMFPLPGFYFVFSFASSVPSHTTPLLSCGQKEALRLSEEGIEAMLVSYPELCFETVPLTLAVPSTSLASASQRSICHRAQPLPSVLTTFSSPCLMKGVCKWFFLYCCPCCSLCRA